MLIISDPAVIVALLFLAGQLTRLEQHRRLEHYYLERKEAGRAATEFEAAVSLKPDSATAQDELGVALRLLGDPEGVEKALRLQP